MTSIFTKNIITDFTGLTKLKPDLSALMEELRNSSITIAVDLLESDDSDVTIIFKADLSLAEETILTNIVSAHTGIPLQDPEIVATKVAQPDGSTIYSPVEKDGKQVYVMSPSTEGLYTWLTARGDNLSPTPPASGRGEGQKLYLSWDGTETLPSTKEAVLDWMEPVELHDGHMNFDPSKWGFEDEWSFLVRLPANTPVANSNGTGNCNLIDIPNTGGTLHIIVPAAGNGAFDIDLNTAIPSPCGKDEEGYWNIVNRWTEEIEPNEVAIKGTWNLFDFANELYFMKNLNCGDPRGIWDLDAYKAEWISSRWKLVLECTRVTAGAAEIGGDLMCFRPGAL